MTKETIAIVGMGCRLPGAGSVEELWGLLSSGTDATSFTPPSRYDAELLYSKRPERGKVISQRSGYIEDVGLFDAEYFGMSEGEANALDPQQRLLMMVAVEAFEDAGISLDDLAGTRSGVYIGNMHQDYWSLLAKRGLEHISPSAIYNYLSILSGRLAYTFDLRGPSISLDTACSSSLVTVHLACQALRTGEAEIALAGGVNLKLTPDEDVLLSQVRMLAPDGRCKFGDASANGFAPSDGVGLVVLKTLSKAQQDGDRIRGLLLGSVTSNDGALSGSLLAPSTEAHAQMLRWAYEDAGVDPADVSFVEAHGTGTPMIDPVEFQALSQVMGAGRPMDRPLLVGSIKSNIGHTEGAAGVASLIKTVLCLENRCVVPSLHFKNPNPKIPWDDLPLKVPTDIEYLPETHRLVAGISAQGISSANTHLVVGEAPESTEAPVPPSTNVEYLFRISAKCESALIGLARKYLSYLEKHGEAHKYSILDICFSSCRRRARQEVGYEVLVSTHGGLTQALRGYLKEGGRPAVKHDGSFEFPSEARYVPLPSYAWQLKHYWLPKEDDEAAVIPPELAGPS